MAAENGASKSTFESVTVFFTTYTPVILVMLLVSAYALASLIFIECGRWIEIGCREMNGVYISQVSNPYSVKVGIERIERITGESEEPKNKESQNINSPAEAKITIDADKQTEEKKCEEYKKERFSVEAEFSGSGKSGENDRNSDGELLWRIKCRLAEKIKEIDEISGKIAVEDDKYTDAEARNSEITASAEMKQIAAEKTKQNRLLAKLNTEKTQLETTEKSLKGEIAGIRRQISSRYSSRLMWVFFSMIYGVLCLACFVVCGVIVFLSFEKDLPKTVLWLGTTTVVGIALCGLIFASAEHYLFLFKKIFDQSLNSHDEMPFMMINLSNAVGFGAAAFLVAASCAVLKSIKTIEERKIDYTNVDHAPPSAAEMIFADKNLEDEKLKEYAERVTFLRTVLYVGTAMLVVGLLRLNSLLGWHRTFISTESENAFVNLFNDFANTIVSVEGAFYTLLLAAIYLPAVYIIRQKAAALNLKDDAGSDLSPAGKKAKLKEAGLTFSLSGFVPRLVVILSPFLTGQVKELFNFLSSKG